MKKILIIPFVLLVVSCVYSCYYDNLSELTPSSGVKGGTGGCSDTAAVVSYANHVVPILQTNCGINNSCHGANNTSGYNLSAYNGVKAVAVSGTLMKSITWTGGVSPMPQNGNKMSDCNISVIQKWVDAGALNN